MKRVLKYLFLLCIFLLLLLSFSLNWIGDNFGGVGFDEIIFHLKMPLQGTGNDYVGSYMKKALIPAIGITVELIIAYFMLRVLLNSFPEIKATIIDKTAFINSHRIIAAALILVVWTSAAMIRAQKWFGFFDYAQSMIQTSNFLEKEYTNPKHIHITFPENKRNLIYILMESAETSSQDKANGGLMGINYIPEMTEIAKSNVSFSQSDLLEGAAVAPSCGWTVAGMTAETAGLPLKSYVTYTFNKLQDKDISFLPGLVSLGDILEEQGYRNYFMAGSDFSFAGKDLYCKDHGNYTILDYDDAIEQSRIAPNYKVWWGFEDEILYQWAKDELTEISKSEEPFNFSLLTVDTHPQDGYVCNLCESEYSDQYSNVWRCASRQVDEFVRWCQEQPFYENTTILIAGDHCSGDKDFYGEHELAKDGGDTVRKVYNAYINAAVEPVKEKNRQFTTFDLFPSTLAAMGCQIEGEHLGLGVNLFSDEETLSEKYGYEYFFRELRKQSAFYNKELMGES